MQVEGCLLGDSRTKDGLDIRCLDQMLPRIGVRATNPALHGVLMRHNEAEKNSFSTHSAVTELLASVECRNLSVHAHSVPEFRPPARPMATLSLATALLILSSPQVRLGQLLDFVHHAVQVPLRVDLGASSVVQAGQVQLVMRMLAN